MPEYVGLPVRFRLESQTWLTTRQTVPAAQIAVATASGSILFWDYKAVIPRLVIFLTLGSSSVALCLHGVQQQVPFVLLHEPVLCFRNYHAQATEVLFFLATI